MSTPLQRLQKAIKHGQHNQQTHGRGGGGGVINLDKVDGEPHEHVTGKKMPTDWTKSQFVLKGMGFKSKSQFGEGSATAVTNTSVQKIRSASKKAGWQLHARSRDMSFEYHKKGNQLLLLDYQNKKKSTHVTLYE